MNELGFNFQDTVLWRRHAPAPEDMSLAAAEALLKNGHAVRPPVRGTVFGTLLNDSNALAALGDAVNEPPYQAPPKAPILYIKPRNTHGAHGDSVPVPYDADGLLAQAALGIVMGRTACRVAEADALTHVAGYTIVNDLTVPHDSFYRPALPCKARDHSCPMGPWIRAQARIPHPDRLTMTVRVDGIIRQQANTEDLIRPVARLIQDVSEFMTLSPGDVLLAGVPPAPPLVCAGQTVSIEIEGLGMLENTLVAEKPSTREAV